ncbi:cupin domain-containing protein [Streptomyces sp. N35]|uniref:cupin domain-containing protein n=1 Tax=Streptomyces sp. N35 TaxID=2795730 RepID=UPI0018F27FE5|nr:cupin domain-containing protein [Streptomyces sp. N35]
MFPIRIDTQYVRGDMPVTRIDPQGAPFTELAAARIQLLAGTGMEAHAYEESEVLLTGVEGEVRVGDPGRGEVALRPGACVMVPRGELFTLANRTGRPATLLAVLSRGDRVESLPRSRRVPLSESGRHLQAVA